MTMRPYLNQTLIWHRKTQKNEYGEFGLVSRQIQCRVEGKRRLVRDSHGHEVVSQMTVWTYAGVSPEDFLEVGGVRYPVLALYIVPDIQGMPTYREVAI